MNFRYRKNDHNSGVQLQVAYFTKLYSVIYFDLRAAESITGDPRTLILHYRLNQAVNAQDYAIYAALLNEEEFVIKAIGNDLVAF